MILLTLQVRVKKGLVAFATSPEYVVLATQLQGDLHRLLHLCRSVGEDMGVRIGASSRHVARIGKKVRRSPEEAYTGSLLQLFGMGHDPVQILVRFGQTGTFRSDVTVMERPKGALDFTEELKSRIQTSQCHGDRIRTALPRANDGSGTERIGSGSTERMPIRNGKTQVLLHRLAVNDLIRIVVTECQRIIGTRACVADFLNLWEVKGGGHWGRGVSVENTLTTFRP